MSSQHSHRRRLRRRHLPLITAIGALAATSAVLAAPAAAENLSGSASGPTVLMSAAAARALHTASADGRMLGGFTAQGAPVVAGVSKNGKQIKVAATTLNLTCASGNQLVVVVGFTQMAVGHHGAVSRTMGIPPTAGSTASITGGTETLTGTLNRKRATFLGVWDLQLNLTLGTGQTDQCDSGNVAFAAVL